MRDEQREYLEDITSSILRIEAYVDSMGYAEFEQDEKTADAVLRNFEIMGEAAKNISDELVQEHSEIPWKEMAGMRDRLIHAYTEVDLEIVWKTIDEELPELKEKINEALEQS